MHYPRQYILLTSCASIQVRVECSIPYSSDRAHVTPLRRLGVWIWMGIELANRADPGNILELGYNSGNFSQERLVSYWEILSRFSGTQHPAVAWRICHLPTLSSSCHTVRLLVNVVNRKATHKCDVGSSPLQLHASCSTLVGRPVDTNRCQPFPFMVRCLVA